MIFFFLHPGTLIVPPSFECCQLYASYHDSKTKQNKFSQTEKIKCVRRKSNNLRTKNGENKSDRRPCMGDKKILKTFHGKETRIEKDLYSY